MKAIGLFFLFIAIFSGCNTDDSAVTPLPEGISIETENGSYAMGDSVVLFLKNDTKYVLVLGYRCSFKNLEMYYQQKENDKWSGKKWFGYMTLKCMTIQSKVNDHSVLRHVFSSAEFKTSGTYRLLVPVYLSDKDSSIVITSNSFVIEER